MLHAWTRRQQTEARIQAVAIWQVMGEAMGNQKSEAPPPKSAPVKTNGHTWVSPETIFSRAGITF